MPAADTAPPDDPAPDDPAPDDPATDDDALARDEAAGADTLRRAARHVRQARPDALALYVFGSTAQGQTHAGSDLDLALLLPHAAAGFGPLARWTLQEDLAAALGRDVDLVDLRTASTVMRAQVVRTGRLLFETDRTARQRFEMVACSMYAAFNVERRAILEDVRRRGTVYRASRDVLDAASTDDTPNADTSSADTPNADDG